MDQSHQSIGSALDELCISENGRIARKRRNSNSNNNNNNDNNKGENQPYKSKNLIAERNRRQKLHDRLMELRGLVPNITNMKKATIVEDAIDHIKNLQDAVEYLNDKLLDAEASPEEGMKPNKGQVHAEQEIEESRIQPDISVARIFENKLWVKVIFEKKRCGFTKFVEAVSALGFEVTDTSLTTYNGAMLLTSSLEGFHCASLSLEEMRALLLEIVQCHLM